MKTYDTVIIGGGISGASLLYTLTKYTDVNDIALFEKEDSIASINSNHTNNSQTLHFGDIETNYSFGKAKSVRQNAEFMATYLEEEDPERDFHDRRSKMVLAVGDNEVPELEERYPEFKPLFPRLSKIRRDDIEDIEPKVVEGRDPSKPLLALQSDDGFVVDYGQTAQSFVDNAEEAGSPDIFLNTGVEAISQSSDGYVVRTTSRTVKAKILLTTAGPQSLMLAQQVGVGDHLSLLPIAGSYFEGGDWLNGKVYTLQMDKLPFAAVHGDADVHNSDITRFGPTAKLVLMLERYKYSTVPDFFKTFSFSWDAFASYASILSDWTLSSYMAKNVFYDIPFIDKRAFISHIRKVVPSAELGDIQRAKGYGGVRPQIVNTEKRTLDMGEAVLHGDNAVFNITPSPGASTSLGNARRDAKQVTSWLDAEFDDEAFLTDHVRKDTKHHMDNDLATELFEP